MPTAWMPPNSTAGWARAHVLAGCNDCCLLCWASAAQTGPASELVRRLNVSGDVQVDEFTIEKLSLRQLHLRGSLQDLRLQISDGRAQWAGGNVRATMLARFVPRPVYDVHAELDGVNLSHFPSILPLLRASVDSPPALCV